MEKKLTELIDKALTRRSFMARSGAAAAVAVVAGCGGNATPAPTPTPTPTPTPAPVVLGDADYLNFALNLEYLEAEFYLRAATGSGLSATDTGNATTTVVVPSTTMVPGLTTAQQNYIYEIAQNELDHVRFASVGFLQFVECVIDGKQLPVFFLSHIERFVELNSD